MVEHRFDKNWDRNQIRRNRYRSNREELKITT